MIETRVQQLSDGEELVVEELIPSGPEDPRERTMETRRLAVVDDDEKARPRGSHP